MIDSSGDKEERPRLGCTLGLPFCHDDEDDGKPKNYLG